MIVCFRGLFFKLNLFAFMSQFVSYCTIARLKRYHVKYNMLKSFVKCVINRILQFANKNSKIGSFESNKHTQRQG